jgi:hypothetical protein
MPAVFELPWDRPRPAAADIAGATVSFDIPRPLADRLREFSRRQETTLFTALLTAFTALLHRLSGSHDIVVGTPVSSGSS